LCDSGADRPDLKCDTLTTIPAENAGSKETRVAEKYLSHFQTVIRFMKSMKIITMLLMAAAVFAIIAGCTTEGPVTPTATPTATMTTVPTTVITPTTIPVTTTGLTTPPTITTTGTPTTTATTTVPTTTTQKPVTIDLTAKGFAFNTSLISVPAGAAVTIRFNNQDAGVTHNFALYDGPAQTTNLFRGELITGVKSVEYRFTAPIKPGDYYFRCDPHAVMNGVFRVT
jgi:plastocyanin